MTDSRLQRTLQPFRWIVFLLTVVGYSGCASLHSAGRPNDAAAVWMNSKDRSELVYVPSGPFTMGSETGEVDEAPQQTVDLPAYWIGKYLVTNEQFVKFLNEAANGNNASAPYALIGKRWYQDINVDAGGHFFVSPNRARYPATGVTWSGARAYCAWAGLRLPTEPEWEKAARGTDDRIYPWGNTWENTRAKGRTSLPPGVIKRDYPVDGVPEGASPYGCECMVGNVWQWCSSIYAEYPYRADDGRESVDSDSPRVIRGGAWTRHRLFYRVSNRYRIYPTDSTLFDANESIYTGFRVACSHTPLDPASPDSSPSTTRPDVDVVRRVSHPPLSEEKRREAVPSLAQDDRYRLTAGPFPAATIVGYPATRAREARYPLCEERLYEQAGRDPSVPRMLVRRIAIRRSSVVADIGAGGGYFTETLAASVGRNGQVWATDISVTALRFLRQRIRSRTRWQAPRNNVFLVLHDVTDTLLPAKTLDLAFMSEVHYFYFPRAKSHSSPPLTQVVRFYRSIRRSLKPDGRLVILEVFHVPPPHGSPNIWYNDPQRGTLTVDEIAGQLRQAGFALVRIEPMTIPYGNNLRLPVSYNLMTFVPLR